MHKKLFLTLISLAALHTPIRAMEEGDFVVRGEGGIAQPAVAKAGPKVTVAKKAAKAIPIPAKAPAPAFGTVELSDDESDNGDDASDTSGGTSQSSTPAQDTPPVPAALPKKAAPAKMSAVAAASPKIAPASPAPAMKKAVQKSAPPKPMPAPQHVEEAAASETVQIQVSIERGVFDSLFSAISRGQRAVSKRMNPYDYVLNPENPAFYAYMLQQIEAAESIEDLQPLLADELYGDAFKALFDRRSYAVDLERSKISEIIRTGKTKDTDKLEDLSKFVDASEESQNVCSAATRKVLDLIKLEAEKTANMAKRAADKLPRSGALPSVSEEDNDNNG